MDTLGVVLTAKTAFQFARHLFQRAKAGLLRGAGLMIHGHELLAGRAHFKQAVLVVTAALLSVLVAQVHFDASDLGGQAGQPIPVIGLDLNSQCVMPLDIAVGVDLYLHAISFQADYPRATRLLRWD